MYLKLKKQTSILNVAALGLSDNKSFLAGWILKRNCLIIIQFCYRLWYQIWSTLKATLFVIGKLQRCDIKAMCFEQRAKRTKSELIGKSDKKLPTQRGSTKQLLSNLFWEKCSSNNSASKTTAQNSNLAGGSVYLNCYLSMTHTYFWNLLKVNSKKLWG